MLLYSRMKSVGVQLQGNHRIVVSGVLEDELYAMECELVLSLPDMIIETVQTKMKRFTTERCPEAEPAFLKAEGMRLGPELDSRIKKEIGRTGCRHMAGLMVDCCRAAAASELARELHAALEKDPSIDKKAFSAEFLRSRPALQGYMKLQ